MAGYEDGEIRESMDMNAFDISVYGSDNATIRVRR